MRQDIIIVYKYAILISFISIFTFANISNSTKKDIYDMDCLKIYCFWGPETQELWKKTQGVKTNLKIEITQYISEKTQGKSKKTQLPATQVVAICLKIAGKKAWHNQRFQNTY